MASPIDSPRASADDADTVEDGARSPPRNPPRSADITGAMPSKRSLVLLSAMLVFAGCPAPEEEFEAFTERAKAIQGDAGLDAGADGAPGPCTPPAAGEADGDYLFALAAKIAPTKPLVFRTTVSTTAAGGLQLSMTFQPLAAADRATPIGMPVQVGPVAVGADGAFTVALPTITLAGEANPISGSQLVATPTLTGTLCAPAATFCGAVTGTVTAPLMLDLTGSTFAAVRITDPANPPEAQTDCAGTTAPLTP